MTRNDVELLYRHAQSALSVAHAWSLPILRAEARAWQVAAQCVLDRRVLGYQVRLVRQNVDDAAELMGHGHTRRWPDWMTGLAALQRAFAENREREPFYA